MTRQFASRLAFVLPLLAYTAIYFVDGTGFHPSGDGYYSWIFARSFVFDGDFDFTNDYALCGDTFLLGVDRGTGHPDNPFYAGPAVFWVPPLFLLRVVFTIVFGGAQAVRASCGGWMTALTILMGPVCGALSVWLGCKTASLLVRPSIAAFVALLFAFTSPLFPYSTSVAHYSHVYLTLSVAIVTYLSVRMLVSEPRVLDCLPLGLAMMTAVLCRPTATLYAVVPLAAVAWRAYARRSVSWRAVASVCLGVTLGAALTCSLYHFLYARWFTIPQGDDFVHMTHAHPLLLMFGVHGGFFFWMPAAWLAVPGFAWGVCSRRLRLLTVGCLFATCVEVVISSAVLDWDAAWTLGARRLLPLMAFVILFASTALEHLLRAVQTEAWWSRTTAVLVLLLTLVNNIPASTTIRGDKNLSQAELYGAWSPLRPLWSFLDRRGVDVALLPAEAYFAARYQLPMISYRDVLTTRYTRNYRTLAFENEEFDMREPWIARSSRGAGWSEGGLAIGDGDAHFIFTAGWPFATHVRFLVSSDRRALLRVASRGWSGATRVFGEVAVEGPDAEWLELTIPAGAFDSGVNEWVFRARGGTVKIVKATIQDRTTRTPHG